MKDARPSRWLALPERPRWPQHRPDVAPLAKPSRFAVEPVELIGPAKSFGSEYTNLADAERPKKSKSDVRARRRPKKMEKKSWSTFDLVISAVPICPKHVPNTGAYTPQPQTPLSLGLEARDNRPFRANERRAGDESLSFV